MKTIQSVEEIKKVFSTTGSMPVLVHCEDYEDYVCKYDANANRLFNEYVAGCFLNIWGIATAPFCAVQVLPEHIPNNILGGRIQPAYFNKPCFGSQHLPFAQDLNQFFTTFKKDYYQLNKIINKYDLLKIGLFDIWIANTDRSWNNQNLLLNPTSNGYTLIPIDHVEIFDGSRLGSELAQITLEDSILYSDFSSIFLHNHEETKHIAEGLVQEFYICLENCKNEVVNIINDTPPAWGMNLAQKIEQIRSSILEDDSWLKDTETNFLQYVEQVRR